MSKPLTYLGNLDLRSFPLQHTPFAIEVIIGGAPGKGKVQNLSVHVKQKVPNQLTKDRKQQTNCGGHKSEKTQCFARCVPKYRELCVQNKSGLTANTMSPSCLECIFIPAPMLLDIA